MTAGDMPYLVLVSDLFFSDEMQLSNLITLSAVIGFGTATLEFNASGLVAGL
ncbi:hypothetical protein B0T21DRAFT_451092 [Apiosordaria backusii]|uniref:Uncharacterized protein n=1 Tax=Apiosordaria backusii TaxID=314023 RepID=A0AA40EFC0_9PEZI|nr:hypothetical protein B0T21DRAFT_451092 [Apiosordaria backusii]